MTPQERQLVSDLFDRLVRLETSPRDADAERVIAEGLARAPHAIYPLVQTVLLQDEALKRADARIRELGGEEPAQTGGGFLDTMRNAFTGRASVPSVRAAATDGPDPRWNAGGVIPQGAPGAAPYAAPNVAPPQGGSFLGTAAATAAGVIGGAMLYNSLGSMFGHRSGSAAGDLPPANAHQSDSPWGSDAAGGDLAREAGLNDIGSGGDTGSRGAGLFDSDADIAGMQDDLDGGFGGDLGGGDSA